MRTQIWIGGGSEPRQLLLEIDATVREAHGFAQEATEHPVEDGVDISDHIRTKPDALTLECVHSNTPIMRSQDFLAAGLSAAPGRGSRVADAYQRIRSLAGRTCEVVTELRKYDHVALLSCDVTRTSATGDVLAFVASFREIRRVHTSTVRVRAAVIHGNKAPDTGTQPTTKADEATKRKSALVQVRDAGAKAVDAVRAIFK